MSWAATFLGVCVASLLWFLCGAIWRGFHRRIVRWWDDAHRPAPRRLTAPATPRTYSRRALWRLVVAAWLPCGDRRRWLLVLDITQGAGWALMLVAPFAWWVYVIRHGGLYINYLTIPWVFWPQIVATLVAILAGGLLAHTADVWKRKET